jgi:hypothetical protein
VQGIQNGISAKTTTMFTRKIECRDWGAKASSESKNGPLVNAYKNEV